MDRIENLYIVIHAIILVLAFALKYFLFPLEKDEKGYLHKLSVIVLLFCLFFTVEILGYHIFFGD